MKDKERAYYSTPKKYRKAYDTSPMYIIKNIHKVVQFIGMKPTNPLVTLRGTRGGSSILPP